MNLDLMCQQATTRVIHYINRAAAQHLHLMRKNFGGIMTADEYRAAIRQMLQKAPPFSKIESVEATKDFKKVAETASKTAQSSASTLKKLQDAHNALAAFYGGAA